MLGMLCRKHRSEPAVKTEKPIAQMVTINCSGNEM